LVKGWRRYKWTDLVKTTANDTLNNDSSARFIGNVTIAGKPIKKKAMMAMGGLSEIRILETVNNGKFILQHENLLKKPDKKLTLMVADKNPDIYTIDVINPYKKINIDIADRLLIEQRKLSKETNTQMQVLNGFEKAIALKEVIIKDHNDDGFFGIKGWRYNSKCPDYVCINNILNCKNHPYSYRKPEIGKTYAFSKGDNMTTITYSGCTVFVENEKRNFINVAGINTPKEYYPIDSTLIAAPEPEYFSTIYWNYGVKIDSNNEVDLSFYTGDITGRFKVIIQGADETEVWSKQLNFTVKKKITP
jgi:hypothetical protein